MDSWPLWLQWLVLFLVGGTFFACSWWLALDRARTTGAEPETWGERTRTLVGALRFTDWAFVVLLVAFLVPLLIRSAMALAS